MELKWEANPYEVPSKINCAILLIAQRLHAHFDTASEQKLPSRHPAPITCTMTLTHTHVHTNTRTRARARSRTHRSAT